jgi:WD40 repeat protein
MSVDLALGVVSRVFQQKIGRPLTEAEIALVSGAWQQLPYDRIADRSGYTVNYLQRDVGPKFWKLLSQALDRKVNKVTLRAMLTHLDDPMLPPSSQVQWVVDWGEAPNVDIFHGRDEEIAHLSQWIVDDRCRLVAITGMGGMGKSLLAAKVAQQVQDQFEYIIWRSLRNAPSLETLLAELVPFLSQQQDLQPKSERLLYWLQTRRCLVILDNQETLLQPGEQAGQYTYDFADYGSLLEQLGQANHQSCVLLTSREKSTEIAVLEDAQGAVRSLSLQGSWEAAQSIIAARKLVGTEAEKHRLGDLYRCNPLALKMVTTSIQSLFSGSISAFLHQETLIFKTIRQLLDRTFERLSPLERTVMYWLAINREWTTIAELQTDIVPLISRSQLLESLESLTWRSLIENRASDYTQQPVIMEYVTEHLIHQLVQELLTGQLLAFTQYALVKTTVLDYIRETQIRLILDPLTEQLQTAFHHNAAALEQHLRSLFLLLRQAANPTDEYGAGNLINLCLHLDIDLTGSDLSQLKIRHAHFQGVMLHQVNFQAAQFVQSSFTQVFAGAVGGAFSPDGQRFAVGDTNGGLHIFQFAEMQPLLTIQGGKGWVMGIAWHPAGRWVVTSADATVRLWDSLTGQWLRDFPGYTRWIYHLVWSPDGQYLACAGQEPDILVWDGTTGAELIRLGMAESPPQSCWVWALAWLADGTVLAGAYSDRTIKIWDVATGTCLRVIPAHDYWVLSLALHPQGKILASSGADEVIKLWDWQTGDCLQSVAAQTTIRWLEWSPDGARLAGSSMTYNTHNTVNLWNDSLQDPHVFQGHQSWVWSASWSRDGRTLVSVSHDQIMKLWDTQTGYCLKTVRGYSNSSWCVRWSQDGIRLLISSTNRTVQLWNSQTGRCVQLFRGHTNEVMAVAWSPDERWIASGSADATVRLWDAQTGRCVHILRGHEHWVRSVAWSPDGAFVISSSNDRTLKLWDAKSGRCLLTLEGHGYNVPSVVWLPGSDRVASGSLDGTVRIWDVRQGVCDRVISVNHPVHALAPSPDGKTLASGDYDAIITLWDLDGNCVQTWQGHEFAQIYSLAWNPDGTQIASAASDSTVRIWSVKTGICEQVIRGDNHGMAVDWHPVKDWLAIAFLEQPIQCWNLSTCETLGQFQSHLPYEGLNIAGIQGISEGQKISLKALGAIDQSMAAAPIPKLGDLLL